MLYRFSSADQTNVLHLSSNPLIDEFQNHRSRTSIAWAHSFGADRFQDQVHYQKNCSAKQEVIQHPVQQTLQQLRPISSSFHGRRSVQTPWLNYRQQRLHLRTLNQQATVPIENVMPMQSLESKTTKSVSFDVPLTRDEFLAEIKVESQEYAVSCLCFYRPKIMGRLHQLVENYHESFSVEYSLEFLSVLKHSSTFYCSL